MKKFIEPISYLIVAIIAGTLLLACVLCLPIIFTTIGVLGLSWFTPYFKYVLVAVIVLCLFWAWKSYTKKCLTCVSETPQTFVCPECKLEYEDKEWRDKCEAFCKKFKSCNLDIISHAKQK